MQELKPWVPKNLHFPNSAGTEPGGKEHFELEHPCEGNSWGLFQSGYRNKGEQPRLCLADGNSEGRVGPRGTLRWVALGHLATSRAPPGAPLDLLLVLRTRDVSSVFLRKFASIICKPGRILPEQWIYSSVHYFGTKTFLLGRGLVSIQLQGFIDTCSSVVISFAKAKQYTRVRNLCISISELHDGNCFKCMYGFN